MLETCVEDLCLQVLRKVLLGCWNLLAQMPTRMLRPHLCWLPATLRDLSSDSLWGWPPFHPMIVFPFLFKLKATRWEETMPFQEHGNSSYFWKWIQKCQYLILTNISHYHSSWVSQSLLVERWMEINIGRKFICFWKVQSLNHYIIFNEKKDKLLEK
jgi:hypothetical protein